MPESRPNLGGPVLVAGAITLAITLLRVYGELHDFGKPWVGGGGAIVGISWLMPVFGAWFGWRLARDGYRPKSFGQALLFPLLGLAAIIGGFLLVQKVLGLSFRASFYTINGFAVLGGWIAKQGWPDLAKVDFVYGLLARIPVVLITYFAVERDWNVHYTRMPPGAPSDLGDYERAMMLSVTQVCLWVAATVIFGGLAGAIASRFARARG